MSRAPHTTQPFPKGRHDIVDALEVGVHRHVVHALLELDVTRARQIIRDREAVEGEKLSFTAFIVASLARALDADRRLQAYRDWRGRLVLFDEVDVVTLVESEVDAVAVTADYARGSSGAPVLNSQGQVVAVVSSTESIYYSEDGQRQRDFQMVFRTCIPSSSLWKMIRSTNQLAGGTP